MGSGVSSGRAAKTSDATVDARKPSQVQPQATFSATAVVASNVSSFVSTSSSSIPSFQQSRYPPSYDDEVQVISRNDEDLIDDPTEDSYHYNNNVALSPQYRDTYEPPLSGRSNQSTDIAAMEEMFGNTAMSLNMDNDELLFNLMFFDDGQNNSLGSVMNNLQQETLALHSENNTPYKLNPASDTAIAGLFKEVYSPVVDTNKPCRIDCECAVCKDDIPDGASILRIPLCQHFFHEECLLRWIKLVC